jgi:hypothetical protein
VTPKKKKVVPAKTTPDDAGKEWIHMKFGYPDAVDTVNVRCACGRKLALKLTAPYGDQIVWHKFCIDCRRHIRFTVSHSG